MTDSSSMIPPLFVDSEGGLWLEKYSGEFAGIRIGNLESRLNEARLNVERALESPEKKRSIFFGIEHILYIRQYWDINRPWLVIEKSRAYYEWFSAYCEDPEIFSGAGIVVGEFGYCSPLQFKIFDEHFFSQEIANLVLQIFNHPITYADPLDFYFVSDPDWNHQYEKQLKESLKILERAVRFHRNHQDFYTRIRTVSAKKEALFIYALEENSSSLDRVTDWFATDCEHSRHILLGKDDSSWEEVTERMLRKLSEKKPEVIAYRNRDIFTDLWSVLYLEHALIETGITRCALFTDWFCDQNPFLHGGWSFYLAEQYLDPKKTVYFSMYPLHAELYRPEKIDTVYLPFRYIHEGIKIRPPVTDLQELECDIAVIHRSRIDSVSVNEINELFDIITCGHASTRGLRFRKFLYFFERHLLETYSTIPLFFRMLINDLHFSYYAQTRIRNTIDLVRGMQGLKIVVVGSGWETLLDPAICRQDMPHEEICEYYTKSLLCVDFSAMFSVKSPPLSMIECLACGGFPLMAEPVFDIEDTHGYDVFCRENLIHYRSMEHLKQLVIHYKNNWNERQDYIHHAQKTWVQRLTDNTENGHTLDELFRKSFRKRNLMPVENEKSVFLVAMGYLYSMAGYLDKAQGFWREALPDLDEFQKQTLQTRILKTSLEINSRKSR